MQAGGQGFDSLNLHQFRGMSLLLHEFDNSNQQNKLKGEYNDIFIFVLNFILTVVESGLINTSVSRLGNMEFTVKGEACQELFGSFLDPYVNAYPYWYVEMCMNFEMLYLVGHAQFSYLDSSRLVVLYVLLKKAYFTDKVSMIKNLEEIKDLSMSFCDYVGIGDVDELLHKIQDALAKWR